VSGSLTTALFGFGKVAAGYAQDTRMARHYRYISHAQVLTAHPAFSWSVVVDPNEDALRIARDDWEVTTCVPDISLLDAREDIEVAVIATPPEHRLEIVESLPALKAIIVEKPLGLSAGDARQLLDRCALRNIVAQVNLWRRADRTFRWLANGELAERIGTPQAAHGIIGNGLINNASHIIDFAAMLLGKVQAVQAIGEPRPRSDNPLLGDPDQGFALFTASGAVASFLPIDFNHYRENSFDVWGTHGRLEILVEGLVARRSQRSPHRADSDAFEMSVDQYECLESTVGDALWQLYDNLVSVVRGDTKLFSPAEGAWEAQRAIEAIKYSARCGGGQITL